MSEIVFILGAGASKEAGAPVIADFLDKADELRKIGKLGEFKQDFDRVFSAISNLQVVHSKAQLELDNIESVFATFEMGRLTNGLPGVNRDEMEPLLLSIRRLILKTLEETIKYPIRDKDVWPTDSYNKFAILINNLTMKGHRCSIITFNYDYALDYALSCNRIPADYCLPGTKKEGVIPLMKLHGSLNWASCSKCGEIIPFDVATYLSRSNVSLVVHIHTAPIHMNLGTTLAKSGLKHCEKDVDPNPVIVPPTWNKTEYHQVLSSVWRRAASEFSTAENIFVSGYSLNESDLFFRYLFALGSIGPTMIKRFWVFDPDPDDKVETRFHRLVGPGTKNRYHRFRHSFSKAIDVIDRELNP